MSDTAINDLATAAGLLVDWEDAAGETKTVAPDNLRAILSAMTLPADTPADIESSRSRLQSMAETPPTLLVADVDQRITLPGAKAKVVRLRLESGEAADLPVDGGSVVAPNAPGYHQLELDDGAIGFAVAPLKAFTVQDAAPGRSVWGATVQLYALNEVPPRPFGDFGALARFAAAAAKRGADALAISPIHALFLADAGRYSPYAPSTRLFLNGFFAPTDEPGASAPSDLIDWPEALLEKRAALRQAFSSSGGQRDEFEAFRRGVSQDLKNHAIFEALHARFFEQSGALGWPDWPAEFQNVDSLAVAAFANEHADEVAFHLFVQWRAEKGLTSAQAAARDGGMAIGLIADLAVGMDAGGSHAWSRRDDLLNGLSVGAPPDLYQPKGQDWGLATFSPLSLKANGYAPFIATLRAAMQHAGGVRIDHAMGLRRLWLTPHGSEAKDGAYLTYPFEDMLRLIKLESYRNRAVVLAEDLGTVPKGFREDLDKAGVMGMRVLWFEQEGGGFIPPDQWSASAAAMTSTHDLPTVAGWWRGADLDWRTKLADTSDPVQIEKDQAERSQEREALWNACSKVGPTAGAAPDPDQPARAVDAAVAFVGSAACQLALVQIEDLIGTADQANLPGVTLGHPNWRRRLPASGDALFDRPEVRARIEALNDARPK